jgi:hypothetical protein
MNDRLFEAAERGHVGIDVQRIGILTETIYKALVRICLDLELSIMLSLGSIWHWLSLVVALESKTSKSSDEITPVNSVCKLSLFPELKKVLTDDNDGIFALFLDIKNLELALVFCIEGDARFDHVEFFLSVKQVVQRELGNAGTG